MINTILYSNLIVSLSTLCLSAGIAYAAKIDVWWAYGLLSGFATFFVYNTQRLFKIREARLTTWLLWVQTHQRVITFLSILALLITLFLFFFVGIKTQQSWWTIGISGMISLFYVVRIGGRNLRELPYLKIYLIAISWSLLLICFPLLNESTSVPAVWLGSIHFLYFVGVTIPFDIRDLKYDTQEQRTLPQIVGVVNAKIIALFLVVLFGILMLWTVPFLLMNPLFFLSVFLQISLILFTHETRNDRYFAGAIDGSIALLGISYFFTPF